MRFVSEQMLDLKDGMLDRPRLQPLLDFFKGLSFGGGAGTRAGHGHAFALSWPPVCLRIFFFLLGAIVLQVIFFFVVVYRLCMLQEGSGC